MKLDAEACSISSREQCEAFHELLPERLLVRHDGNHDVVIPLVAVPAATRIVEAPNPYSRVVALL